MLKEKTERIQSDSCLSTCSEKQRINSHPALHSKLISKKKQLKVINHQLKKPEF